MFKRSFSLQSSHVVMASRFVPERKNVNLKKNHWHCWWDVVLIKASEFCMYLSQFWSEATSWCIPGEHIADCRCSGTAESKGWKRIPPPSGRYGKGRLLPHQNPPEAVYSRKTRYLLLLLMECLFSIFCFIYLEKKARLKKTSWTKNLWPDICHQTYFPHNLNSSYFSKRTRSNN